MKCPERANLQRQKLDERLPGSCWGSTADGYMDAFCGAGSVPQLHCGGGCTTV